MSDGIFIRRFRNSASTCRHLGLEVVVPTIILSTCCIVVAVDEKCLLLEQTPTFNFFHRKMPWFGSKYPRFPSIWKR